MQDGSEIEMRRKKYDGMRHVQQTPGTWGISSGEKRVPSPPRSSHVSMELMGKVDAQSPLVQEGGREATWREKRGEAEDSLSTVNIRHEISYFLVSIIISKKALIACFASWL